MANRDATPCTPPSPTPFIGTAAAAGPSAGPPLAALIAIAVLAGAAGGVVVADGPRIAAAAAAFLAAAAAAATAVALRVRQRAVARVRSSSAPSLPAAAKGARFRSSSKDGNPVQADITCAIEAAEALARGSPALAVEAASRVSDPALKHALAEMAKSIERHVLLPPPMPPDPSAGGLSADAAQKANAGGRTQKRGAQPAQGWSTSSISGSDSEGVRETRGGGHNPSSSPLPAAAMVSSRPGSQTSSRDGTLRQYRSEKSEPSSGPPPARELAPVGNNTLQDRSLSPSSGSVGNGHPRDGVRPLTVSTTSPRSMPHGRSHGAGVKQSVDWSGQMIMNSGHDRDLRRMSGVGRLADSGSEGSSSSDEQIVEKERERMEQRKPDTQNLPGQTISPASRDTPHGDRPTQFAGSGRVIMRSKLPGRLPSGPVQGGRTGVCRPLRRFGGAGRRRSSSPDEEEGGSSVMEGILRSRPQDVALYRIGLKEVPLSLCEQLSGTATALDVSSNELTSLPDAIVMLKGLRSLVVSSNKLEAIPAGVVTMQHLLKLHVQHNKIRAIPTLPDGEGTLPWSDFNCSHNLLQEFPKAILRAPGMRSVNLMENPGIITLPDSQALKVLPKSSMVKLDNDPALMAAVQALEKEGVPCRFEWNPLFPDKILPFLYLGALKNANDRVYNRLNITHVATIGRELDVHPPPSIEHMKIAIDDVSDENIRPILDSAHGFIARAKQMNGACFVHCFKGQSRSATVVVSYLMVSEKRTVAKAMAQVRAARPQIRPNEGFLQQIVRLEETMGLDASKSSGSTPIPRPTSMLISPKSNAGMITPGSPSANSSPAGSGGMHRHRTQVSYLTTASSQSNSGTRATPQLPTSKSEEFSDHPGKSPAAGLSRQSTTTSSGHGLGRKHTSDRR